MTTTKKNKNTTTTTTTKKIPYPFFNTGCPQGIPRNDKSGESDKNRESGRQAFLDYASIFFGIFWENEHFFSFFLEKELLAFSVIFHDCDPNFSTQNSEG